jgi:hypothetical protein
MGEQLKNEKATWAYFSRWPKTHQAVPFTFITAKSFDGFGIHTLEEGDTFSTKKYQKSA